MTTTADPSVTPMMAQFLALKEANEGAVRKNIREFIDKLLARRP